GASRPYGPRGGSGRRARARRAVHGRAAGGSRRERGAGPLPPRRGGRLGGAPAGESPLAARERIRRVVAPGVVASDCAEGILAPWGSFLAAGDACVAPSDVSHVLGWGVASDATGDA